MTQLRKTLVLASGLLVAVIAGWILLRPADGGAAPADAAAPHAVVAPGLVEAQSERIELGFDAGGRVAEVLVEEGERVTRGQVLARLDAELARARVARAEAAVASARARRDLAMHGARREEIAAAEAELEAARAQAWERGEARARGERLLDGDAIAPAEVDGLVGSADAARAGASAAAARLALLLRGTRAELRAEAAAALAAAEADLMEARTHLAHRELVAPMDGVILRRLVEPGEQVTTMPPTVAFTLADTARLQIRAEVDEADVARVAAGHAGWATADAWGDRRFPGRVVRVTSELGRKHLDLEDPRARVDTRVLEVIFVLDEGAALPLGLRMDVHLE